MTDQEKAEKSLELLLEAGAILGQLSEDTDPLVGDIVGMIAELQEDIQLLDFDEDGALLENDEHELDDDGEGYPAYDGDDDDWANMYGDDDEEEEDEDEDD